MTQEHGVQTGQTAQATKQAPSLTQKPGGGVLALQALMHNGAPAPAAVATLIDANPSESDAMLALLHSTLGNGYVAQVMAASKKGDAKKDEHGPPVVAKEEPKEEHKEEHKEGAHLDLHSLGEEQIRDIVFFRAGKAGKNEGKERYDAGHKPRNPKPGEPTEDMEYDFETWEHAKHRLEELEIQGEGAEETEFNVKSGTLFSRSTNNESRSERREADERLGAAKDKVAEKEAEKGHYQIGAAKRAENQAEKNQDKVYEKTKDPVGEAKEKAEKDEKDEKAKLATERVEALADVKKSQAAYQAALDRLAHPAKGPGSTELNEEAKAEAIKAKLEMKAALETAEKVGANDGVLKKAWDKLAEHTELEMSGDLVNVVKTTGDKEVWGERHDSTSHGFTPGTEVETHLLSARADAKANLGISKNGLNAEASVGGKAVLVEAKEQWKWEMPGHFMGEAVNTRLFFQVSGMIGAEAHARLKANVGKLNPKEPKLDMNQVSAGVDGFAGMKASVGVGAAFEWEKLGAESYKQKTANAGKVIVDLVSALNPPLGFLLRQMDADTAAGKMMQFLMNWGKSGTVPLAAIEATIEGSAGIGGTAQASIGMHGGHFDFVANANATFGVGLGGKVKVSLDVVEGPKFALITMGELRPIAIKFAEEKVKQGIELGSGFINDVTHAISDWWHTKDRAHEAVRAKVPEILPGPKNIAMIDALFGWYCTEEDQLAIVEVLLSMQRHGQIGSITGDFSMKILSKLDGAHHRKAAQLMGAKSWK